MNSRMFKYLSSNLRKILEKNFVNIKIHEIRLRVGLPLIVHVMEGELFISEEGEVCNIGQAYIVTQKDIKEVMDYISNYSLYAYEEELKNGYITVEGGNRIGISGKTVIDNTGIVTIRNISSINIRIAKEFIGCSDKYMDKLYEQNELCHTLIVSPPCCGKTTFLRDIIRNLSDGYGGRKGVDVGVVDERGEIAAMNYGICSNNVGIRTDVLDGCPKAHGIIMMIRSMGPKVIAVDEIGKKEDVDAIEYSINSGCKIIATIHSNSYEDLLNKPVMKPLIQNKIFGRYIVMSNTPSIGTIDKIYNTYGGVVWKQSQKS